jgi:hypothetical protein
LQIDGYIQSLREDLPPCPPRSATRSTARAADLLAVALESSLGRASRRRSPRRRSSCPRSSSEAGSKVRVAGGDPELVYVEEAEAESAGASDEAFSARITLGCRTTLKARLEAAAGANGVSVNTWLVRTLSRLLAPGPSGGGSRHRLTGYGRKLKGAPR